MVPNYKISSSLSGVFAALLLAKNARLRAMCTSHRSVLTLCFAFPAFLGLYGLPWHTLSMLFSQQ